jgi:hypothetical protein
MDLATLEANKTVERFHRSQDRIIKREGYGATDGALGIAEEYLCAVADAVTSKLNSANGNSKVSGLEAQLRHLRAEVVALATLQAVFHSIGIGSNLQGTLAAIGAAVEAECWAAKCGFQGW